MAKKSAKSKELEVTPDHLGFMMHMQVSDEELEKLTLAAAEMAVEILADQQSEGFVPVLIVSTVRPEYDERRERYSFHEGMRMHMLVGLEMKDRHTVMEALGVEMAGGREFVRAIFFVSEAWVANMTPEERDRYRAVSEHPRKREAVVVMGLTLHNRAVMTHIPVVRNQRNAMITGPLTPVMMGGGEGHELENPLCASFYYGYMRGMQAHVGLAADD